VKLHGTGSTQGWDPLLNPSFLIGIQLFKKPAKTVSEANKQIAIPVSRLDKALWMTLYLSDNQWVVSSFFILVERVADPSGEERRGELLSCRLTAVQTQ